MGKSFKKIILNLHLWIGLATGLLFFIIAFSGALYTWEPEISRIIYNQAITPQDQSFASITQLKTALNKAFPKGDFRAAQFQGRANTAELLVYVPGTYYHAFMNPYTAELIHLQDMKKGWLNHLRDLHRNLMLGPIGRHIVHWVTLFSLFMLITGIVLWWPVNKLGRKQRLKIKWNTSPKRLNYDLHNVLGFYASWIAIFMVITGIYWGFSFVKSSVKTITQEDAHVYEKPLSQVYESSRESNLTPIIDSLTFSFLEENPDKLVRVNYPHHEADPIHIVLIDPQHLVYNTEHYYFDRYTATRIEGNHEFGLYQDSSTFHIVNGLVYDFHLGNIGGLLGRILVSLASLIMASLPITGFIIWWGKRKPTKSKA